MSDRELLELAAKAVGRITYDGAPDISFDGDQEWNPLDNDGDAMRLSVKLSITVMFMPEHDSVVAHAGDNQFVEALDDFGARRAIVRAAAEIGRAMP